MKALKLRKRLFARMLLKSDERNHLTYGKFKKDLFQNIHGLVVEIGPGSGVNFDYLPAGTDWIGIEPNELLHPGLMAKAAQREIRARLILSASEHIPLEDNCADIVICTFVLCSVKIPSKVIAEMKRVLKPGGKLILIEHVASETSKGLYFVQNLFNPLTLLLADGCNSNRKTLSLIERAGFSRLDINHYTIKVKL